MEQKERDQISDLININLAIEAVGKNTATPERELVLSKLNQWAEEVQAGILFRPVSEPIPEPQIVVVNAFGKSYYFSIPYGEVYQDAKPEMDAELKTVVFIAGSEIIQPIRVTDANVAAQVDEEKEDAPIKKMERAF